MLIITIILIILSKTTILFMSEFNIITNSSLNIIIYGKWLIMLIMLLFGISIIFSIAPAYKQKWKILTPGTILTTFFIILSSVIFNYYIYNFSLYNQIYGSIGTLMIILIWMYFNSLILLIGFELNVTIATRKKITKTHN